MIRFHIDQHHEYEDSIHVEIQADECIPGNGVQTAIAATFFMTKDQFVKFVDEGMEYFDLSAGELRTS